MSARDSPSLERALADIELLQAAYPDEVVFEERSSTEPESFPLLVTLHLSTETFLELEFRHGYPHDSNIHVSRYRSTKEYHRLEKAVAAVKLASDNCLELGAEGGLACCASALEAWNADEPKLNDTVDAPAVPQAPTSTRSFSWLTGQPFVDRKSTFQAHVCRVSSAEDVRYALDELLLSNSKLQRASHNMVRLVVLTGSQLT